MIVGFTGTQYLKPYHHEKLFHVLNKIQADKFVVGGCIGVDTFVAWYGFSHNIPVHVIVPSIRTKVDTNYKVYATTVEELPPGHREPYRQRNTRLVTQSDALVAFPMYGELDSRSRRSGTWMTIRIARRHNKPVSIYILEK